MSNQFTQLKRANRKGNIRRIVINEVNLTSNYISGTDRYGNTFRVSFSFHGPIITIPQIGETWTVQQYQQEWFLDSRQLDDYTKVSSLENGDKLIDSSSSIILDSQITSIKSPVFLEETSNPTPIQNGAILYSRLNNSNKIELCVQFPTGSPIVITTEP